MALTDDQSDSSYSRLIGLFFPLSRIFRTRNLVEAGNSQPGFGSCQVAFSPDSRTNMISWWRVATEGGGQQIKSSFRWLPWLLVQIHIPRHYSSAEEFDVNHWTRSRPSYLREGAADSTHRGNTTVSLYFRIDAHSVTAAWKWETRLGWSNRATRRIF